MINNTKTNIIISNRLVIDNNYMLRSLCKCPTSEPTKPGD